MTSKSLQDLVTGYRIFRKDYYAAEAQRYRSLAAFGQTPKTMVVACSDSRVDPARIFNAGPGELFVVRNVANIVPPFEGGGEYHGTSAALEFAVRMLHVDRILVLGHARCGGVQAFIERQMSGATDEVGFIGKWISLLGPAYADALRNGLPEDPAARQRVVELTGICQSIVNLETFDFIREAQASRGLKLCGGYFDISSGDLQLLDVSTHQFRPVSL